MTISFNWNERTTFQKTGECLPSDILDRAKYAEYLTNYLQQYKMRSYVFNINSNWGTGKTYFIKRWAISLNAKHPVVYFNSWKFDHNNEPLILILSELTKQLNALLKSPENSEKKENLNKAVTKTVKHIAPTLGKGIFRKMSGVNWDDLTEEPTDEQKDEISFNSELVSVSTQAILNLHTQQQKSIEQLKKQVSEILCSVLVSDNADNNKRWSPMYVFIDELDRCRPTFAIEVLEVIKHIFDIPRIIFVIATDTEQLQHSIKAVYGNEFNAEKYLMRFFNRSFALPEPALRLYIRKLESYELVKQRLMESSNLKIFYINPDTALDLMVLVLEGYKLDLRSVNQILERVACVLSTYTEELGVLLLLTLECLRVKRPDSFNKLWTSRVFENSPEKGFILSEVIRELNLDSSTKVNLNPHDRLGHSIFAREMHESVAFKTQSHYTSQSLTSIIFEHVNTSTRVRFQSVSYVAPIAYLQASMDGGNGENIFDYKGYVELASNLT